MKLLPVLAVFLAVGGCSPSDPVGPGPVPPAQGVELPQRGGGTLEGVAYAPAGARPGPAVVVLPGGGAPVTSVAWAAERLAAAGYAVLVVRPARGASAASYHTAAVSGVDYLTSNASPLWSVTDTARVGVAGWSLGARALTRTQAEDGRVDALVAWDNLAVSETGDAGSPACRNKPAPVRPARVPALGQASETCSDAGPDAKLTAFEHWRAAGVPAVQVVLAGADHFAWSAAAPDRAHDVAAYYTVAWFDRWLRGDRSGTDRVLARTVLGRDVGGLLSERSRSAASVDGVECSDLRAGCP